MLLTALSFLLNMGLVNVASANVQPQVIVRAVTQSFQDSEIQLGNVAEFIGFPFEEEDRLSKIVLGQPPAPGERRTFSAKDLSQLFRVHLNRKMVKNVRLQIPSVISIEHPGFAITNELVKSQLMAQWRNLCGDCRFELLDLTLPRIVNKSEKNPWKLMPAPELPRGAFSAQLRIQPLMGVEQIFWVTGRVKTTRNVPVVKKSFSPGEAIAIEEVEWQWKDVTQATDRSPEAKEINDKRVKIGMRAGDVLYMGNMERSRMVKRGELVQAMSGDGMYQVSLVAQSEQDGYLGDLVKLKNRDSNKILSGRVSGKGEVRIE